MRRHLLLTNDFPPKIGGIQVYLWELWRRLPADDVTVVCTPHDGAAEFDLQQRFRIERSPEPVLLPYPWLPARIRALADDVGAEIVIIDPAVPLGLIGPALGMPYGVVLHGAEVTIPGRAPGIRSLLGQVLKRADLVIAAGEYALAEAERCAGRTLPAVVVPPGVDVGRFRPPTSSEHSAARAQLGIGPDPVVISSVSRLVPRKGIDLLIRAVVELDRAGHDVQLVVGGTGRERRRLDLLARQLQAPVSMLGALSDADVVSVYQASDIMAMLCHDRWWGLEQEGFGIVFLEAAAVGIPQVAGRSGGAAEAVEHGVTGLVVDEPQDLRAVVDGLGSLVADGDRRRAMGTSARARAVGSYDYDLLAGRLERAIDAAVLR